MVLLLLISVTATNAAPTTELSKDVFSVKAFPIELEWYTLFTLDRTSYLPQISQFSEPYSSYLAEIAADFLKPPANLIESTVNSPLYTRPLPAIPKAALMVLVGFLCISLVKDRKLWLTILAALLWVPQSGLTALPQLAWHLRGKQPEQQASLNLTYLYKFGQSSRLRSDIEGTRYIGLLHHLAGIPGSTHYLSLVARVTGERTREAGNYTTIRNTNKISPFAITRLLSSLILTTNCSATIVEHPIICFSPAFIFQTLPHGPPKQT